jgi:hypothetical protein
MKEDNTTHFEIWLAAYESRLIELKEGKSPEPQKPAVKAKSETEAQQQKRP